MRGRKVGMIRLAVVSAVLLAVVGGVLGMAASNTVPSTKAGDGTGAISGYVVSSVAYTLNGSNAGNIDEVAFSLDATPAAGATLKAKLESSGSTWYTCSNTGTSVTCDTTTPQATVSGADELRVVVVG